MEATYPLAQCTTWAQGTEVKQTTLRKKMGGYVLLKL